MSKEIDDAKRILLNRFFEAAQNIEQDGIIYEEAIKFAQSRGVSLRFAEEAVQDLIDASLVEGFYRYHKSFWSAGKKLAYRITRHGLDTFADHVAPSVK